MLAPEEEPARTASGERLARPAVVSPARSAIPAGRLHLVGLDDVREKLGPSWPAAAQKVQAIAEATIARRLLPGDVFEPYDDASYVVLFASLGRVEAEFKCRAIRNEITRQLLGSEWTDLSRVKSRYAELPVESLAEGGLAEALAEAFGAPGSPAPDDTG